MKRAFTVGFITLFLTHAAWALYGISFGHEPAQNANWPTGSVELANLSGRYARADGDPGNTIFAYHGDTAAFQAAVDLMAKLAAPEVRLIVHGGSNPSSMFAGAPARDRHSPEDWTFTVFDAERFTTRQKRLANISPPTAMPSPSLDLYLTKESGIDFSTIRVPNNIKVIDERSDAAGSAIRGRVLDMPTSRPIADAQVVLEKNNRETHKWESVKQTRSNAEGTFEFLALPADSYRLNVSAGDHAARIADYIQVLESTSKQCTVQLSPVVRITGKVIDNDGAAVVGASVKAASSIAADNTEYRQPEDTPAAITDAEGKFSLAAPQGATRLRATLDGYYQLEFREATTAPSGATTIRVTKTGNIKGVVVDRLGNPALGDAMVEIRGTPDPVGRWGGGLSLMPDGTFEFKNIPPGEYLISTGPSPDLAHDPNAKTIQVKVGETTEITLEQHARVTQMGAGRRISPMK